MKKGGVAQRGRRKGANVRNIYIYIKIEQLGLAARKEGRGSAATGSIGV